MAFGKKKSRDDEQAPEAPPTAAGDAPETAPGDTIDSEMFASSAEAASGGQSEETGAQALDVPAAEPEPAPPAATGDPLAGGADLLSMFQTTEAVAADRAALLDLAGEVEFDDLLEDLHTVASALGVRSAP